MFKYFVVWDTQKDKHVDLCRYENVFLKSINFIKLYHFSVARNTKNFGKNS
jgi:hypothetical protein